MKELDEKLTLPEGVYVATVLEFEEKDRKELFRIYKEWRTVSNSLKAINARAVAMPEGISESAFCLEMNCVRTTGKIKKKSKEKVNTSFDAYDLNNKQRVQIKACSVIPDLTSFGPNSQWDQLYFIDFFKEGKWDGTFDIYKIDTKDIYGNSVNANQTFVQQQAEKRRPRFSIYKEIIQAKGLKPIKTGDLSI